MGIFEKLIQNVNKYKQAWELCIKKAKTIKISDLASLEELNKYSMKYCNK